MAEFPTLRFGSLGSAVSLLQEALNMIESLLAPLAVDGNYGPKTTGRVREFQGQMSLSQDGVSGNNTWQALSEVLATAGFIISTISGIIQGTVPKTTSWRDFADPNEIALRDKLIGIAKTEADARHGIRRSTDRIKTYMMLSTINPPTFGNSERAVRVNMAGRSWCSDYVYFCLTAAGCRTPVQANASGGIEQASITRFVFEFSKTSTPKPGDLYVLKFTSQQNKNNNKKTDHIGIFRHWGASEFDSPGAAFRSYDGNSLDSPSGDLNLIQLVPDPPPEGTFPMAVGSFYNSTNTRDALLLADGFFLSITEPRPVSSKPPPPTDLLARGMRFRR